MGAVQCCCEEDRQDGSTLPAIPEKPVSALPAISGGGGGNWENGEKEPEPHPEVFASMQRKDGRAPLTQAQRVDTFKRDAKAGRPTALLRQCGASEVEVVAATLFLDEEASQMRVRINDVVVAWDLADVKGIYMWETESKALFLQRVLSAVGTEEKNNLLRLDCTSTTGRLQTLFLLEKSTEDRNIVYDGIRAMCQR
mmetsp:Transcript_57139/g.121462  ORF Transcript_57139/g.121462 Transcript_57139/m.121462 type:complete len:197 (-) Transcript_57139:140-730(-)